MKSTDVGVVAFAVGLLAKKFQRRQIREGDCRQQSFVCIEGDLC